MKKSIAKNYIYNLLYQIMSIVLPLVTTPYISRVLGAENLGIYGYTRSIASFFILFGSLGIGMYGQREIAYLQNDKKKRSILFWEIFSFKPITMSISIIVFYFAFVIGNNNYQIYYKVLLLELLANVFDISWFLQGLEEFKKTVIRNMAVKIICFILVLTCVKTKDDLIIYFVIYVLSDLLGNLSLWLYLPQYTCKVKFSELKIFRHLKPTIALFVPQIAIQVYTLLDKTMIGTIIADKSEVGYYEQSQKIVKMLLTLITSLGTVMLPRIASTFAEGNKEKVKEYMENSFNLVFLLAFPLIFGLISISDALVPFFFGDGYEKVSIIMKAICPIILLIGLSNVTGTQYLLPTKRQKEFTLSVVYGAVVNFIFNSLLIPKFGAIGASIGTIIAESTVTGTQIYYTRKDFEYKKIVKSTKNYFIASLVMFVCLIVTRHFITSNVVSVFSQFGVGILVYALMLSVQKDQFFMEVLKKVLNRKEKNKKEEIKK